MKHDDEVARVSALQLAKREKYAGDIDGLIAKYEGALAQLQKRESEVKSLRRDLSVMTTIRDEYLVASETNEAELGRLRTTLAALRGSRSYRLGRLIGRPLRALQTLGRPGTGSQPSALQLPPGADRAGLAGAGTGVGVLTDTASVESIYQTLLQQFTDAPSKGNAIKVIHFDYFTCGSLNRPAEFIQMHADQLSTLSSKEQVVLSRVQGQAALLTEAPDVPPRQSNAGYLEERGRIMYCAHSSGHFNSNGYSTRTSGMTLGLQAAGEDTIVVARPGYPWDIKTDVPAPPNRRFEQEINGVTHVFNPGPNWTTERLDQYLAQSTDIFVREAQKNRVSLVHSASNYVTALPALIAARRMGVPFVYEVRGLWEITELSTKPWWRESDRFKLAHRMETLVATNADRVLSITGEVSTELIRRGVDPAKISPLPNAVDTKAFAPMPVARQLRRKLGIDEDTTVLGYAGSLVAYEGVADIVSAVGALCNRGSKIALVVVGDGPELGNLKEQAQKYGVADSVIFTGRVSSSEVPSYISMFDIMPCPRLRQPVTEMVSPLKPLEAMASGKAMILSDLAPMRELAGNNGERALLTEPGDVESLSSAIVTLMDNDDLRLSMARRARLWTVRERTWAQAAAMAVGAHREARNQYQHLQAGRSLQSLTVAIIADQFTLEGLRPEVNLIVLHPDSWQEQISSQPIDALFVESAWEGVDGRWHQKIGYYDEQKFDDLKRITKWCNKNDVPTIFWNKEDPVHFNRFRRTSQYFDHVFTSDATCIKSYMENAGSRQKTVSSLSFYAQPKLHNILPSQKSYEHTVNYAGSYYGDRFVDRSTELSKLLTAATESGLSVYDRQHLNPDSPYRFPDELARYVRGGLDYAEMVEAYKAHPVHINVNSVADSPTMFSRRVMEIVASGGTVVSGKGRGVEETFGGFVPVVTNKGDAGLLIRQWMNDEESRLRDAWLSYRLVHRMHTAAHRLTYVLRTAGLTIQAPEPQSYGVYIDKITPDILDELSRQTVPPTEVYYLARPESITADFSYTNVVSRAEAFQRARKSGLNWIGELGTVGTDRTYFEDLLSSLTFGTWSIISTTSTGLNVPGLGMAQRGNPDQRRASLSSTDARAEANLVLRRPDYNVEMTMRDSLVPLPKKHLRILIAGHDLKFAGGIVQKLELAGHNVTVDNWTGHSGHDEQLSRSLLRESDVIFCEWTLGNAVWYSKNKSANQRLVTRLHLQELSTAYLQRIDFNNVDSVIFVGQHTADLAIRDHGVPAERSTVIPNYVNTRDLVRKKIDNSRFNLGLVGIIPERKRLDIALDIIRKLRQHDERFQLHIKGKRPEEYPWMVDRPDEMSFYVKQFMRIESDPLLKDAVHFDGYGDDMAEWYRKIGSVLSVSDFESFHLTLADGAASGAVPASLAWPGADQIYPEHWLSADVPDLLKKILAATESQEIWLRHSQEASEISTRRFDQERILERLVREIVGA